MQFGGNNNTKKMASNALDHLAFLQTPSNIRKELQFDPSSAVSAEKNVGWVFFFLKKK